MSCNILQGDCRSVLATLPDASVQMCVTSPPYWGLRDYGIDGQLGLERTPEAYVENLVSVFRDVRRVLRDDGTLWLNLGDTYAVNGGCRKEPNEKRATAQVRPPRVDSLKPKDMAAIPWSVAIALRNDGWYLRSDIIWAKPNPIPEKARDRPTKSHEYLFLLSKTMRYHFDFSAVERKTVWTVVPSSYKGAHFATFPPALAERCILAGSRPGDAVLDPFSGAGTTGLVAARLARDFVGIELNPEYVDLSQRRIDDDAPLLSVAIGK